MGRRRTRVKFNGDDDDERRELTEISIAQSRSFRKYQLLLGLTAKRKTHGESFESTVKIEKDDEEKTEMKS